METECPQCKSVLEIDESLFGQELECPACGTPILIESPKRQPKKIVISSNRRFESNEYSKTRTIGRPVPTHLGWAIFVTILGFGSLFGILAIVFAAMASGANSKGDYGEAKSKAKVASIMAGVGFLLDLIGIAICIVFIVIASISTNRARDFERTQITISSVCHATRLYTIRTGHPPKSIQDLQSSESGNEPFLRNSDVIDAWGNPLRMKVDSSSCRIISAGRDGLFETIDDVFEDVFLSSL